MRRRPRRARFAVVAAVRSVLSRTTSLSAALLVAAGEGYAVPDVARLVTLVAGAGSIGRNDRTEPVPGASSAVRSGRSDRPSHDLTDLTGPRRPGARHRALLRPRPALRRQRCAPCRRRPSVPPPPHTPTKEPTVADHVELRTGAYFDSVTLMQVSRTVAAAPGVEAAQVAMATELNLEVIRGMGFECRTRRRTTSSWRSAGDEAGIAAGQAALEAALAQSRSAAQRSRGFGEALRPGRSAARSSGPAPTWRSCRCPVSTPSPRRSTPSGPGSPSWSSPTTSPSRTRSASRTPRPPPTCSSWARTAALPSSGVWRSASPTSCARAPSASSRPRAPGRSRSCACSTRPGSASATASGRRP